MQVTRNGTAVIEQKPLRKDGANWAHREGSKVMLSANESANERPRTR